MRRLDKFLRRVYNRHENRRRRCLVAFSLDGGSVLLLLVVVVALTALATRVASRKKLGAKELKDLKTRQGGLTPVVVEGVVAMAYVLGMNVTAGPDLSAEANALAKSIQDRDSDIIRLRSEIRDAEKAIVAAKADRVELLALFGLLPVSEQTITAT